MNLDEFLEKAKAEQFYTSRAQLEEPGFSTLYVRYGRRYVKGEIFYNTLDVATVEAAVKGQGTFKKLIARVRENYPYIHLFVENVMPPQLREHLMRTGFEYVGPNELSPCFFLRSKNPVGEKGVGRNSEVSLPPLGRATES